MLESDVKIIMTIAETQSFSKAGKLLHLSQPAISNRIQAFENQYGIKLFNRSPQGVTLTDGGKIVCGYAARFTNLHSLMEQDLSRMMTNNTPSLIVGASCTVGNYTMPLCIRSFKDVYPKIVIKLDIQNTKSALKKLRSNENDLAIIEGNIDLPDFTCYSVDLARMIIIASNYSKGIKKQELCLSELSKLPFIVREKGSGARDTFETTLLEYGYPIERMNICSEMTSIHSVKGAVEEGLGLSIVPAIAVQKELELGSLRAIRIREFPMGLTMKINLVHLKNQALSVESRKFIDFLLQDENIPTLWKLKSTN